MFRFVTLCVSLLPSLLIGQTNRVDFRYAPYRNLTAICFPNDWLKTVVTETNGLGYDFGPGPYTIPLTEVQVGAKEREYTLIRQILPDPRVPIVDAEFRSSSGGMRQTVFAVPLGKKGVISSHPKPAVQRLLGWNGTIGWAIPPAGTDPAFRNAAWGVNRPILYRVPVRRGGEKLVALGICEPYKWGPGTRILDLRVEGAPPVIFDPLEEGKKGEPQVIMMHGRDENGDGRLSVEAHAALSSPDPNPFLNAFWIFPTDAVVEPGDLISGRRSGEAELYFDCGAEETSWRNELRADLLSTEFEDEDVSPEITIRSRRSLRYDEQRGILVEDDIPVLISRPRPVDGFEKDNIWHLVLPAGTKHVDAFVLHGLWSEKHLALLPTVEKGKEAARRFWEGDARIPQGRIAVPDSGIQYLLDASIRNLYQIAELVDGGQQFQPGPSVYRGLWVHDAAWHITALLFLGDLTSARIALDKLMQFQLPSGQVRVMDPYVMNKETPIFAYTLTRYARLSGDRQWLRSHWDQLDRALGWIEEQRNRTMSDPASPGYGLFPPAFADGGLSGVGYEYASVFWALAGFRAGADAAAWLGKHDRAGYWQSRFDELLVSYRRAAKRDLRKDGGGHWYLPMRVGDTSSTVIPQQANWAILEAQGLGHVFDPRDSIVTGTLAMLDDSTREGLPTNTGWLKDGLWPFFGSLQGIAHTYQRNYDDAGRLLYAVANHASPLGTWVEEQLPRDAGQKISGDGSNASASALFIEQVRRLLIMERHDTLEFCAGTPVAWYRPGGKIGLTSLPTLFGKASFTLTISSDGASATIRIGPIGKATETWVTILDLRGLKSRGFIPTGGAAGPDRIVVPHGKEFRMTLVRQ